MAALQESKVRTRKLTCYSLDGISKWDMEITDEPQDLLDLKKAALRHFGVSDDARQVQFFVPKPVVPSLKNKPPKTYKTIVTSAEQFFAVTEAKKQKRKPTWRVHEVHLIKLQSTAYEKKPTLKDPFGKKILYKDVGIKRKFRALKGKSLMAVIDQFTDFDRANPNIRNYNSTYVQHKRFWRANHLLPGWAATMDSKKKSLQEADNDAKLIIAERGSEYDKMLLGAGMFISASCFANSCFVFFRQAGSQSEGDERERIDFRH
jgi:hypothetical protein